jgi:hypothetical protein
MSSQDVQFHLSGQVSFPQTSSPHHRLKSLQRCEVHHFPSVTKGLKEYEVREDEDGDPKGNEDVRLRVHHSRPPARAGKIPADLGDGSQLCFTRLAHEMAMAFTDSPRSVPQEAGKCSHYRG